MTTADANGAAGPKSPEEIQEDIDRQRQELADTVDALGHKLDVKSQTQEKVAVAKDRATTDDGKPRPELIAAGAAGLLVVVGLVWWRRRR